MLFATVIALGSSLITIASSRQNLLLNQRVTVDSVYSGALSGGHYPVGTRAVDGQLSGVEHYWGSDTNGDAWINVTIARPVSVDYVEICARDDCCWNRIDGAIVYIYNQFGRRVLCGQAGAATYSNECLQVYCQSRDIARAVYVESRNKLDIGELRAFALPPTAQPTRTPSGTPTVAPTRHTCNDDTNRCDRSPFGTCEQYCANGDCSLHRCGCVQNYQCVPDCLSPDHTCEPITIRPTSAPPSLAPTTPSPTAPSPTVSPCDDGSHDCAESPYGTCEQYCVRGNCSFYRCGCIESYQCIPDCETYNHTCEQITVRPTSAPSTIAPSTRTPSSSPSPSPTFHACTDGNHGCDVTAYGICEQYCIGGDCSFHRCGCAPTHHCVPDCVTDGHTCEWNTAAPTAAPTRMPTEQPTAYPSTAVPSISPTSAPTRLPSMSPTTAPSVLPSLGPSNVPTACVLGVTWRDPLNSNARCNQCRTSASCVPGEILGCPCSLTQDAQCIPVGTSCDLVNGLPFAASGSTATDSADEAVPIWTIIVITVLALTCIISILALLVKRKATSSKATFSSASQNMENELSRKVATWDRSDLVYDLPHSTNTSFSNSRSTNHVVDESLYGDPSTVDKRTGLQNGVDNDIATYSSASALYDSALGPERFELLGASNPQYLDVTPHQDSGSHAQSTESAL